MDVASFRAARRRVLLDYEERQSETTPSAVASRSEGETADARVALESPKNIRAADNAERRVGAKLAAGLAVVVIAALLWTQWPRGKLQAPAAVPAQAAPADLPQEAATKLIDSDWRAADIDEFLRRWRQFSPQVLQATSDDSRIWLLRGETETRLRNARDALSLGTSGEAENRDASERIRQLETVQRVIRAP